MDCGFILLLFLISLIGLVLLVGRDISGMGILLVFYLGVVMVFFFIFFYGKFVYGFFCCVVLFKWVVEK